MGVRLPQYLLNNAGSLFEDFATFGEWTLDTDYGGSISSDTVNHRIGSASLKVTTPTADWAGAYKTISQTFGTAPTIRITFYLAEDSINANEVYIAFTSVTNFSKYAQYSMLVSNKTIHTGWNTFDVHATSWVLGGGESWSNEMVRLYVYVKSSPSAICNVSFDSIQIGIVGYPCVMLNFDDGHASVYNTALPLMQGRNLIGTAYPVTSKIGDANYMTSSNLLALQTAKWIIGNHTVNHADLPTLSVAECEVELSGAIDDLTAIGITTGDYLAYPFGHWDEDALTACRNVGIKTGRLAMGSNNIFPIASTDEMLNLFAVGVGYPESLATVKTWVDKAKTYNTPVTLFFHGIVETPSDGYYWSIANFTALLDYIVAEGLPTITIDEFYQTLSGTVMHGNRKLLFKKEI